MQKSKKQYIKKILIGLAATLVVLISLSLFAVLWQGSTKDIEAVANSFTPPDEWTQTHYEVVPPKFICLTGKCPSVIRAWKSGDDMTYETIEKFTTQNLEELVTDEKCRGDRGIVADYCDFSGKKGGFEFRVVFENKGNQSNVTLFMQKDGLVGE